MKLLIKFIKGLIKFLFPTIAFISTGVFLHLIFYQLFQLFDINMYECWWYEPFAIIVIGLLIFPLLKFIFTFNEKIVEKYKKYQNNKTVSQFLSVILLSAMLITISIGPLVYFFSSQFSNSKPTKEKIYQSNVFSVETSSSTEKDTDVFKIEEPSTSVVYPPPYYVPDESENDTNNYSESSILKIQCDFNILNSNSVGNEWLCEYTISGDSSLVLSYLYADVGDQITITVTLTENDKYPDIGSKTITRTLSTTDINSGFDELFFIDIKENNGTYKGNVAKAVVLLQFTLAKAF